MRVPGQSWAATMFPVTLQFIIAMVAYAINERMARRVEYLREKVRVLKEALAAAIGRTRIATPPARLPVPIVIRG